MKVGYKISSVPLTRGYKIPNLSPNLGLCYHEGKLIELKSVVVGRIAVKLM